jgi:L-ascorbate metabolism protein UlaG (beta-lactamase superfamily)
MKKQKYNSPNFKKSIFLNTEETHVIKPTTFLTLLPKFFKNNIGRYPLKDLNFRSEISEFMEIPTNDTITWLGHSSVIIEIDGIRILTDPAWSKNASPVNGAGPRRFFNSPIQASDKIHFDYILISHNHYDHLDKKTILDLAMGDYTIICPLGVGIKLANWGISMNRIHELDWWEEFEISNKVKLICTPARHFSGRGFGDRNKTLWCSFVIKGKNNIVFFGADSGYSSDFEKIGNKYGPFNITLLEIGASSIYWPDIHMGPENAVKAHFDLKGNLLFPIHWGTYNLAMHHWKEPVEKIIELTRKEKIKLILGIPGNKISIKDEEHISYWWNEIS